jgi:hypothetical protein
LANATVSLDTASMTPSAVRLSSALSLCLCLLWPFARTHAQQPGEAAAGGTVAGTITYGDTQRPARFAQVMLLPVPADKAATAPTEKDFRNDSAAAMAFVRKTMSSMTMLQTQTGLDGSYSLADVAPGDYYLAPSAPGYVSPISAAVAAAPAGTPSAKAMTGLPVIHVDANRTVRGNAALERGAAIAGNLTFDDGAPAAGVMVMVDLAAESPVSEDSAAVMFGTMNGGLHMATADDRGHFRIAGIAAGEYLVKATLHMRNGFSMRNGVMDMGNIRAASALVFYAPGTLHKTDATRLKLRSGEERGDLDFKVNLSGMHTVSGRVGSAIDHHALNSGVVTLTDVADKGFTRSASLDATGAYSVTFVPPGSYTLEVSGAADTEPSKKKNDAVMRFASNHTLKSYEDASQGVIVAASDVAGINLELKESKNVKQEMDMNQILGGVMGGTGKEAKE